MKGYTVFNKEQGYFEVVKSEWRSPSVLINWGMRTKEGETVIPDGYYTQSEIDMAEWELCKSANKHFNIVERLADTVNCTIVEEA